MANSVLKNDVPLSKEGLQVEGFACDQARYPNIGTLQLLLSLSSRPKGPFPKSFKDGMNASLLKGRILQLLGPATQSEENKPDFSKKAAWSSAPRLLEVLRDSLVIANKNGQDEVGPIHLTSALLQKGSHKDPSLDNLVEEFFDPEKLSVSIKKDLEEAKNGKTSTSAEDLIRAAAAETVPSQAVVPIMEAQHKHAAKVAVPAIVKPFSSKELNEIVQKLCSPSSGITVVVYRGENVQALNYALDRADSEECRKIVEMVWEEILFMAGVRKTDAYNLFSFCRSADRRKIAMLDAKIGTAGSMDEKLVEQKIRDDGCILTIEGDQTTVERYLKFFLDII